MELKDLVRTVRARKKLLILPVLLFTLGAIVFSLLQEPAYQGLAEIELVQGNSGLAVLGTPQGNNSYQPGRDEVQTQVEIIHSRRIAARVKQALRLRTTVDDLLKQVSVSADTGTNIVLIHAVDASPRQAAAIANSFAAEYVNWSRESQRASIKAAVEDVRARLEQTQERVKDLQGAKAGSDEAVAAAAARDLYTQLSSSLEQLLIAEQLSTGRGSLLTSATVDPERVSPSHRRNALLGLAVGLLVGLIAVYVAEQLDTSVKSSDEASDICGAPVLSTIPTLKLSPRDPPIRLALTHRTDSPDAEAYRMLRNSLDFINIGGEIKTILVTSALPREGKSTVAANLAVALSQAGSNVMLIACDFRVQALEKSLGLDRSVGLSKVLTGSSELWSAAQKPQGFERLWVLPAGPMPPNPSELLGSTAMGGLVTSVRESMDWVIVDSAPVLATADAAAVSRWVPNVLMVARVGSSRRDSLRNGCTQLRNVGAKIMGLAVFESIESVTSMGFYGNYGPSDADES